VSDDPYSRIYWSVMSDAKFDGIREDARLFGTWSLLLVVADMAWPAPAYVPPTVARAAVAKLITAGLVDELSGGRFRIHGLDKERERRSSVGKRGAAARWERSQSERNAIALPPQSDTNASQAETSKDETSTARDGLPNLNATVAGIWETATGRSVIASGAKVAEYLDDACRRHPPSEVGAAILRARKEFDHIPDGMALVSGMRPILDPFVDPKSARQRNREEREKAAGRKRVEDTLRASHYAHTEADPRCPACREKAS
jgi:hypothetical protein